MIILKYTVGLAVENAELGMDVIDHGMKAHVTESEKAKVSYILNRVVHFTNCALMTTENDNFDNPRYLTVLKSTEY